MFLELNPTIGMFLSFKQSQSGCLRGMSDPGIALFKPYSNHPKGCKDKFLTMRELNVSTIVTTGEDDTSLPFVMDSHSNDNYRI